MEFYDSFVGTKQQFFIIYYKSLQLNHQKNLKKHHA